MQGILWRYGQWEYRDLSTSRLRRSGRDDAVGESCFVPDDGELLGLDGVVGGRFGRDKAVGRAVAV